jgi:hypothetical protein
MCRRVWRPVSAVAGRSQQNKWDLAVFDAAALQLRCLRRPENGVFYYNSKLKPSDRAEAQLF